MIHRIPFPILHLTAVFFILPFGENLNAQDRSPFSVFEDTKSPDGRFAIAWGIKNSAKPPGKIDDLSDAEFDLIENYLVDTQKGAILTATGTTYFPGKNYGSISVSWREDSRAAMIVEGGKWANAYSAVVYITDPDDEWNACSDVIPLNRSLDGALRAEILKRHPRKRKAIEDFVIGAYPVKWTGENRILLDVTGEVPKDLDSFFYEGKLEANLPGPNLVTIGNPPGRGGDTPTVDAELQITANSAGPIRIGMTIGEARRAMKNASFERSSDGEGIAMVSVIPDGKTEAGLRLYAGEEDPDSEIDLGAKIEFIEVWDQAYQTADGISVSTPLETAANQFGGLRELTISEIEAREYVRFVQQPSGLVFRVNHPDDSAGIYGPDPYITKKFKPGAKLFSIEIYGPDVMSDDSVAGIKIDSTEAEVMAAAEEKELGEVFKGKDEIWEVFGQAVQTWMFPEAGLSMDMISDEIGGPKTVLSIRAKRPFAHSTSMGIRLGDPKSKVIEAYADFKTDEEELDGFFEGQDTHLVGSIYGGMVFTFEDGKLAEMYLGASAE
ncbi:MAG: hypothetical protein HKN23_08475 [Verrucomicrobiales bacterium]|nr:hypothetical protein [Verrucomicrobiales bacterium]